MCEKDHPTDQNGVWIPTREFYLANPRSASIRQICIAVASDWDALLHGRIASCSEKRRAILQRRLFGFDTKLVEMGIVPGMRSESDVKDLERDPVIAAEFIAGMIEPEIGSVVFSRRQVGFLLGEFSESVDGMLRIDRNQRLPQPLKRYLDLEAIIEWTHGIFATFRDEVPFVSNTVQRGIVQTAG